MVAPPQNDAFCCDGRPGLAQKYACIFLTAQGHRGIGKAAISQGDQRTGSHLVPGNWLKKSENFSPVNQGDFPTGPRFSVFVPGKPARPNPPPRINDSVFFSHRIHSRSKT